MTSEEYVVQVNRLMDLQNVYMGLFITVLFGIFGFFAYFQWRLNTTQAEEIRTKTIKEIAENLGVNEISEFKTAVDKDRESLDHRLDLFSRDQIDFIISELHSKENDNDLWKINVMINTYSSYISKSVKNFDKTVSEIKTLITDGFYKKNYDISSHTIDDLIDRLSMWELFLPEETTSLDNFKNTISLMRNKKD